MNASLDRFDLHTRWNTAWSGGDIVVLRNDAEVDRIHAQDILRIVFVQSSENASAGDLVFALVELTDEFIVFPAETGLAGRVHFERQAFWAAKACVYWSDLLTAQLPAHYLARRGFGLARRAPCYRRIAHAEFTPWLDHWLIEGPQSWDERRWQRIEHSRPFARIDTHADTRPGPFSP